MSRQTLDDARLATMLGRRHRPVAAAEDVAELVEHIRGFRRVGQDIGVMHVDAGVVGDLAELVEPGRILELRPRDIGLPLPPADTDPDRDLVERIARVAHEANRAYCHSTGDDSQPAWEDAPDWQWESAMAGVCFHLANPGAGPEASHESWLAQKAAAGWTYGPVKDPQKKEHPCFVPFADLPIAQQRKDWLSRAVVHALVGWDHAPDGGGRGEPPLREPVDFASDAAREKAIAAGLSPADFENRTPTGATGFTVADVDAIASDASVNHDGEVVGVLAISAD
jgi:predicted CxxxxCH...CXXCH cytochrome family protein